MDIFNPPSEFDGYEIINEDKENLENICFLLSGNSADVLKISLTDKYEFADSLVEAGVITKDLEQEFNLTEMVDEINRIINVLQYDIKLSAEDVLRCDNEEITAVRKEYKYLTYYDLNMCAKLIRGQGYELFQVFLDCGGLTMSILPENKIQELKKYFD